MEGLHTCLCVFQCNFWCSLEQNATDKHWPQVRKGAIVNPHQAHIFREIESDFTLDSSERSCEWFGTRAMKGSSILSGAQEMNMDYIDWYQDTRS